MLNLPSWSVEDPRVGRTLPIPACSGNQIPQDSGASSFPCNADRRIEGAVKEADQGVRNFTQHIKLSHWHPISTAPYNQEFELRINENGVINNLEFPCLHTNEGAWINVDLGTEIKIQPVEWRLWQREKSPVPHHSKIKLSGRSAVTSPRSVSYAVVDWKRE